MVGKSSEITQTKGSMYGIYANIGGVLMVNVTIYIAAPWILWVIIIGHFSHIVWRWWNFGHLGHRGFAGLVLWGHVVSATRWKRGLGPWAPGGVAALTGVVGRWDGIITYIISSGAFFNGSVVEVNPQKKDLWFMYLTYTNWNFELVVWIPARDPLAIVPLIRVCGDSEPPKQRTTYCKHWLIGSFFGQEMDAMNDWIRCFAGVLDATYKILQSYNQRSRGGNYHQLPNFHTPCFRGLFWRTQCCCYYGRNSNRRSCPVCLWVHGMRLGPAGAGVWLHPPPTSNALW